jgi:hypothetical protein
VLEGIDVVAALFRRWNPGRAAQVLGWSLLATEPVILMLLPAVGIGNIWMDRGASADDGKFKEGS